MNNSTLSNCLTPRVGWDLTGRLALAVRISLFAAFLLGTATAALSYQHKWIGVASGDWNQGQNWTNGVPNPTENRAMRLYFPANGYRLNTRPNIDGLVLDLMEVGDAYQFSGGPGAKLSFRDTNTVVDVYVSLELAGGARFEKDLEIGLTTPIGIFAHYTQIPNAAAGYIDGSITGPGSFHLYGGGTVEFGGDQSNTYGGVTELHAGVLRLNKDGATAIPHALVIGVPSTAGLGSRVLAVSDNQFGGTTEVTVNRSGWLDLDGHSHAVGNLVLAGGRVSAGTGVLTLNGNVVANPSTTNSRMEGLVFLGIVPHSFNIGGNSITNGLEIGDQIFGGATATLTKDGPGWLTLSGTNTYLGVTVVNDGILRANGASTLGDASHGTVVNSGGTLYLPSVDIGEEPLSLVGPGHNDLGALYAFGNSACDGNVALTGEAAVGTWPSSALRLGGKLYGSGALRLNAGTVQLSGTEANTFAGPTRVDGGTLELRKQILIIGGSIGQTSIPGALFVGDGTGSDVVRYFAGNNVADAAAVTLAAGGVLDLNGHDDTIGSLVGDAGQVTLGGGQLTIGANGQSTATSATIAGAGGRLRKVGPGTLTLRGANSYSGATTVEVGTLIVNGVQPASAVTVKTNAVLAGAGTVGAITAQGGRVSPGDGVGRLQCAGVTMNNAAIFQVELRGVTAGSEHDQLKVTGSVNLGGAGLSGTLGFAGAVGNQYVIISNDGSDAVAGTFVGRPEGSTVPLGGATFQISYHGGDGNDVVLTQLTPSTQDFSPTLAIVPLPAAQVRLSWSTNAVGFQLQSLGNLGGNSWANVSGSPVTIGDRQTVTLSGTNASSFYRLVAP